MKNQKIRKQDRSNQTQKIGKCHDKKIRNQSQLPFKKSNTNKESTKLTDFKDIQSITINMSEKRSHLGQLGKLGKSIKAQSLLKDSITLKNNPGPDSLHHALQRLKGLFNQSRISAASTKNKQQKCLGQNNKRQVDVLSAKYSNSSKHTKSRQTKNKLMFDLHNGDEDSLHLLKKLIHKKQKGNTKDLKNRTHQVDRKTEKKVKSKTQNRNHTKSSFQFYQRSKVLTPYKLKGVKINKKSNSYKNQHFESVNDQRGQKLRNKRSITTFINDKGELNNKIDNLFNCHINELKANDYNGKANANDSDDNFIQEQQGKKDSSSQEDMYRIQNDPEKQFCFQEFIRDKINSERLKSKTSSQQECQQSFEQRQVEREKTQRWQAKIEVQSQQVNITIQRRQADIKLQLQQGKIKPQGLTSNRFWVVKKINEVQHDQKKISDRELPNQESMNSIFDQRLQILGEAHHKWHERSRFSQECIVQNNDSHKKQGNQQISEYHNQLYKIYAEEQNKWLQIRRDLTALAQNQLNISIQEIIQKVNKRYYQLKTIQDRKGFVNAFSISQEKSAFKKDCPQSQMILQSSLKQQKLANGIINNQIKHKQQFYQEYESSTFNQNNKLLIQERSKPIQKQQTNNEIQGLLEFGGQNINANNQMKISNKSHAQKNQLKDMRAVQKADQIQAKLQKAFLGKSKQELNAQASNKPAKLSIKQCLLQQSLEKELEQDQQYVYETLKDIKGFKTQTSNDNFTEQSEEQIQGQWQIQNSKMFQRSKKVDVILPYTKETLHAKKTNTNNYRTELDQSQTKFRFQSTTHQNKQDQANSNIQIVQVQQNSQQQFLKKRLQRRRQQYCASDIEFSSQAKKDIDQSQNQTKTQKFQHFDFNPSQNSPNQSSYKQEGFRIDDSREFIISLQIQLLKFVMNFRGRAGQESYQNVQSTENYQQVSQLQGKGKNQFWSRILKPIGIKTHQLIKFMRKMASSRFVSEFGFSNPTKKSYIQQQEQQEQQQYQQQQGQDFSEQMLQDLQFEGSQYEQVISLNEISDFIQMKASMQKGQQTSIYQQFFDQAVYDLLNLLLDDLRPYGKIGLPPVCFDSELRRHKKPNREQIIEIIKNRSDELLSIKLGIISILSNQQQMGKVVTKSFDKYNQQCCMQFEEDWKNIYECQFEIVFELMEQVQREILHQQFVCIFQTLLRNSRG